MINKEQLAVISAIDNRVRELEILDLVQIGSYNANLSVFSIYENGRINILEDQGNDMVIELCDASGKLYRKEKVPRKTVIRSIIDSEFSLEDLKIYERYLSYRMFSALDQVNESIDTIQGLYDKKVEYRKELSAVNDKVRQYENAIDYDYCLVGSECLYSALRKTRETIRREYIREGVEAATVNDKVERLERDFLGKIRHKNKISRIKEDGKKASANRADNIKDKKSELEDTITKYRNDLMQRCLRVLGNMKVIGIARVSYVELIEGLKDKNISDVMRDEEITPTVIYDYFINNLVSYEMNPEDFLNTFKGYILGYLYRKQQRLETGLISLDGEIKKEFGKQKGIYTDFVSPRISFDDMDDYSKVHK